MRADALEWSGTGIFYLRSRIPNNDMPSESTKTGSMSPSPKLTPSDLERIYANRFSPAIEYRQQVWKVLATQFFSRWISPAATVLDLGCGYCEFINNISAAKKYGIDLNPTAGQQAEHGVTVLQQDCSEPWPLADGVLDVVFTSNFVEHLATKVALEQT